MDPYDLRAVFTLRERIRTLPAEPTLTLLAPTTPAPSMPGRRVAVISGSFNPPTSAHLVMAERALSDGFDTVVFVLARRTAGKQRTGMILEDRLFALDSIASPAVAVGVASAALYCDQAEAARRAFPDADIAMLVGSDKLEQIFDASWYEDRDASLARLFTAARLVVSPRGDGADVVRHIRKDPANDAFASRVDVLPLHPAVGDLSSTRVRGLLASGADPSGLMPSAVAALMADLGAFAPADPETGIDRYAVRSCLLDVLWDVREWAVAEADLRALTNLACAATSDGERLRAALRRGRAPTGELAEFQRAAAAAAVAPSPVVGDG